MSEPAAGSRAALVLTGVVLIAAFFGLSETVQGLHISFVGEADRSATGEVYFWLGAALLLLPGAALLGYGLVRDEARLLRGLDALLAALGMRRAALIAGALAFVVAAQGNRLVLRGYPITDDETGHRFGGQVLALGRLTSELPLPLDTFPNRFLWLRGAVGTSMEWPGVQLAWALAEVTHLGALLFALCAALPALALARLLWRRVSPRAAAVGVLLWLFSPMAFALSLTTHAHLLSRGLLALAILCYDEAGQRRRGLVLAGLCVGGAFTCRAPEIAALVLPLVLAELGQWLVRKDLAAGERLRWLALGALGPLLIFFLHPLLVSGSPVPLRFTPESGSDVYPHGGPWHRFGAGLSYNLLMLAVWVLGPLGLTAVPLWVAGAGADRLTRLLLLGVVVDLLLTLTHDIGSLHVVGPIHRSECVVPLLLIAVHGLWRIGARLSERAWLAGLFALVLGLGIFNGVHALALRRQADLQASIYDALEQQVAALGSGPALVLVPRLQDLWIFHPLGRAGSKVFDWRRPRPDFSDAVLLVREVPGWERLRQRFPQRRVLRLRPSKDAPYLQLTPVP